MLYKKDLKRIKQYYYINMSRKLSEVTKKKVAANQHFKCNNKPGSNLRGIGQYECPLWKIDGENKGIFDRSGYEIDHIIEWCLTQNDDITNLQALCRMCHGVKTSEFTLSNNIKKVKKNKPDNIITNFNNGNSSASRYIHKMKGSCILFAYNSFYIFNQEMNIWSESQKIQIVIYIIDFVSREIQKIIDRQKTEERKIKYIQILKKYTNTKYIEDLTKLFLVTIKQNDMSQQIDNNKEIINFKNVVYNLKTNEIRKRIKEDYISKCLDYDYNAIINEDINIDIRKMIFDISNSDDELFEFNLSWLGYCLTGETRQHKMLFMIGYSGQNGKTALARMYHSSLPIYSVELTNKTLNENFMKGRDQLIKIQKPVRFCIIEEPKYKDLDVQLFKKIVDDDEILYGTTETIYNHSKLYVTSNTDPRFITDNGVKRRGLMEVLKNKFIDKNEYDKLENTKGYFIKDNNFNEKFMKDNKYKLEFVRILLEYANIYYEKGLNIPETLTHNFNEVCEENDTMQYFVNKYYEITNVDDDRIHRDTFLDLYNEMNKTKFKWNEISSDVKRIGLIYARQKRVDGLQGAICGLRLLNTDDQKDNKPSLLDPLKTDDLIDNEFCLLDT